MDPASIRHLFYTLWRDRVIATLSVFESRISRIGGFGIASASIVILASEPSLSTFHSGLAEITGKPIAGWVERWKNAPTNDELRDELLRDIAEEIAQFDDQQTRTAFDELDLIYISRNSFADHPDLLGDLVSAGYVPSMQGGDASRAGGLGSNAAPSLTETRTNTGGGAYIAGSATVHGDFIGRDKIIYNSPPPLTPDELTNKARKLIDGKLYSDAVTLITQGAGDSLASHGQLCLLLAIALLRGRSPALQDSSEIVKLESYLHIAVKNEGARQIAMVLLGIIKHDYYWQRGRNEGKPSLEQLRGQLHGITFSRQERQLLAHLSASSAAKEYLGISW